MSLVNLYDKILPRWSGITVELEIGTTGQFVFSVEPEEGYKFQLSAVLLDLSEAPEVQANVNVVTEKGEAPLFVGTGEQGFVEGGNTETADMGDYGYPLIDKLKLVIIAPTTGTTTKNIVYLKFTGRLVTPQI